MTSEPVPLQIVAPRLPPRACGIGTYAWALHQHWPGRHSQNRFLVFAEAAASREYLGDQTIEEFPAHAARFADFLEQQEATDVLLHYAGRAYHRFGFPRWMPDAFTIWQRRDARRRLHVIFHELPANFPLLSKQGILQRLSFAVARRLAEQAATLITNSEHHATVLNRWRLRSAVEWFPVPSNIPAPVETAIRGDRRLRGDFAVFGLPYTRLQTLRIFLDWISIWKKSGRLLRLHLIGPPDNKFTPEADALLHRTLSDAEVVNHGELSPANVSKALFEVECCLSNSNELTWSKSGTFMACAAHGCPVVTERPSAGEPLRFTIAAESVETMTAAVAREKGARLRRWYLDNADWDLTARRVAEIVARR